MEVDGNTAASVQDASFLKKDAGIVDEKMNNAVENAATENVESIKKSEADCSSTVDDNNSLDKLSGDTDDLLEQIEEVCNEKIPDLKNSEEISKTSEHEFLKKIEEIENNDKKSLECAKEKLNNVDELKSKNIIDCEASAIDEVIVGDKVLDIKEENSNEATKKPESASSSKDSVSTANAALASDKQAKSTTEVSNKDTVVSSSTTQSEKATTPTKPVATENLVQEVESTGTNILTEDEKTGELMETKSIDEVIEDTMEVDNGAEANNEIMEIDASETMSDDIVEVVSIKSGNEATSKQDTVKDNKSEIVDLNDIDMKEVSADKVEKEKPCQNSSVDLKSVGNSEKGKPNEQVAESNHKVDTKEDEKQLIDTTKPENKILLDLKLKDNVVSSSLTNTPVSSSNVYNSTPIQKQFEISSENVSKISDAIELSHTEREEEATSTKPLSKSFEDSTTESGTCATSETDQPSSDGTMKKYIDAIKKYNGMPDTTTDEEDSNTPSKAQKANEEFEIKLSKLSGKDIIQDSSYEVNVCCEQNDIRYLSIERVDLSTSKIKGQADKVSVSETSVQSSSNGSITSLPPYSLPPTVKTPSSASTSSSTNCHSIITHRCLTASQKKHTILGIEELCNFMINQFTKIKHAINPDSAKAMNETRTPTQQNKKNKKNSPSAETPSTSTSKAKRARKRSIQEDDVESTPKAKQAKRDISKETPKKVDEAAESENSKPLQCVLAKWVDKKFYAGKVTSEKPGSKYVVLFEDGASKTLPKESIVFGEGDTLPLQDQQVYALVEEDYESGTVLSIEKSNNKVYYTVKTETTTVKVTASDIYLEVDQAKEIQKIHNVKVSDGVEEEESTGTRPSRNKRPPASPSTPEAGYSGAVGKRGGKRQKRLPVNSVPPKRLSDASDSSDSLDSTPPASPKEKPGLELVEGVQPELQNSQNDSELSRMIFISDYKKSQPDCDVDELLGPLPNSNTLFRNKPFLLTCTIGLRPHRYHQENCDSFANNRFKQFSPIPYVKHHLQKQLEAGGAKVYNYFEDVPKNKYKQCKLIAPRPCITAKYVQCLSSDIQAISHDWVIESCRQNKVADVNKYILPAGWSIIAEMFVPWKVGKNNHIRLSGQPFAKTFVLIAGANTDFAELWGRVCKAGGAKLRIIKSIDDITPTTTGYMVAESDFSQTIKAKAQHYGIPIVSTVWVVQSLIMGTICPPNSHPRLTQLFEDDEI